MSKKKFYLATKIHCKPKVNLPMFPEVGLPDGCEGIMFVFKTKKAGREFSGKNTKFDEINIVKGNLKEKVK